MPVRKVALLLRLSQELKQKLTECARREHRSVNQQIEFILENFFAQTSVKGSKPDSAEGGGEEKHRSAKR
jgi:hypothetical protein